MALTLVQYLQNPVVEKICPQCNSPISEGEPTGRHFVDMEEICPDCYFDGLGNLVEKNHPDNFSHEE